MPKPSIVGVHRNAVRAFAQRHEVPFRQLRWWRVRHNARSLSRELTSVGELRYGSGNASTYFYGDVLRVRPPMLSGNRSLAVDGFQLKARLARVLKSAWRSTPGSLLTRTRIRELDPKLGWPITRLGMQEIHAMLHGINPGYPLTWKKSGSTALTNWRFFERAYLNSVADRTPSSRTKFGYPHHQYLSQAAFEFHGGRQAVLSRIRTRDSVSLDELDLFSRVLASAFGSNLHLVSAARTAEQTNSVIFLSKPIPKGVEGSYALKFLKRWIEKFKRDFLPNQLVLSVKVEKFREHSLVRCELAPANGVSRDSNALSFSSSYEINRALNKPRKVIL